MLDTTPTAAKGLLQRARAGIERYPRPSSGAPADPGTSAGDDEVAQRYAEACTADGVDALVVLLTSDAWLAVPPVPHLYDGTDAIARFLGASAPAGPDSTPGSYDGGQRGSLASSASSVTQSGPERPQASSSSTSPEAASRVSLLQPGLVKAFLPTREPGP